MEVNVCPIKMLKYNYESNELEQISANSLSSVIQSSRN